MRKSGSSTATKMPLDTLVEADVLRQREAQLRVHEGELGEPAVLEDADAVPGPAALAVVHAAVGAELAGEAVAGRNIVFSIFFPQLPKCSK